MKRVLATIAIGAHERILQDTGHRFAAYAAMIGAEYLVVDKTDRDPPHYAKFDLFKRVVDEGFDSMLFIDADIYIRRQAPNIFDHYESAAFSEVPHPKLLWLKKGIDWIRNNLDADWPADRYYNTGVIVAQGQDLINLATITAAADQRPGAYFEQDQLNVLMRDIGFPRQNLDQRWNQFCCREWVTKDKARAAYFLHGTGAAGQKKLELVQKFAREYP